MNAKAYALTLIALVLGMTLLFLTDFVDEIIEVRKTYNEINFIERVNAKYDNVRQTYIEMLSEIANVSFDYNGNILFIYDKIPSKQEKDSFKIKVEKLKLFALQEKEDIDININNETKNLDLLRIVPFDMNYDYTIIQQRAPKDYKHIYLSMKDTTNVTGLIIYIYLLNQSFVSMNTRFYSCVNCQNPLDLNITIFDPNGNIAANVNEVNIDASKNNNIKINTTLKGKKDIIITLKNLVLDIYNSNVDPYAIRTALGINPKINAEMPKIRFDFELFEVAKTNYRKSE